YLDYAISDVRQGTALDDRDRIVEIGTLGKGSKRQGFAIVGRSGFFKQVGLVGHRCLARLYVAFVTLRFQSRGEDKARGSLTVPWHGKAAQRSHRFDSECAKCRLR